jgi:hypothetical protein
MKFAQRLKRINTVLRLLQVLAAIILAFMLFAAFRTLHTAIGTGGGF